MLAVIDVKWNGKRFPIEFQTAKALETTPVKDFKAAIQRVTGVDSSAMKLQAFGAVMNNDDMPLSIYGLRSGSYITMKVEHKNNKHTNEKPKETTQKHHGHQPHHHHHSKQPEPNTGEEAKLIDQLNVIQKKLNEETTPQVAKYERDVKEFLSMPEKTDKLKKKQFYMAAFLNEQLMHVLFDLDAFTCGPNNPNARQVRKDTVKLAQGLLDKVDGLKSIVNNTTVEENTE